MSGFDPCKEPKLAAKRLLKGVRAGDKEACARARAVYRDLALVPDGRAHELFGLMRAYHVIARELGYNKWEALQANPPPPERLSR